MKITDLTEDGRIVKGVNTTPDVQPGETERQAKKLFPMNKNGKPQSLGVPGASPNVAFNIGLTEDELTTVQRAEMFAQQAHKDHQRKYTGDPYYVHLDEVRRIVKGAGGSEDMQAAALLHDTVEDTSVTSQDILKEFGPRIAKLVVELTDISKPEDGNRATRKAMDRNKLAGASAEAQTIKYADLISNGKDIMQNDPKFAKVYMKEKADLLRVMTKGDSRLRSAALAMLPDELKENMSVTGTERRRLEKKKGLEIGSPEWFKHWFDLPYLRERYDDVGQKIYKGNTTRVVNTPVADKNISVADKRIAKFSQQRDMDDMTYKGAKITAPGTNQAIAKAKANINRAYSKQDKIDQRQGAGQSYITKGKPVKFSSSDKVQLNMSEGIQKVDVAQLEKFADRLFAKVGIDVEFTRHFMDRVNDIRNQKPITMSELTRLFKQEYKRWGKPIAQMGPDSQAVMKDLQTDINLPFVLKWDDENNELDLIAKTVMRKADFKTPNKEFPVESVPMPVTKKDAALQKQAQHMVMKSKIDQKPNVDMMQITNKAMRDHVKGIGQDADKLSKAAGIPRDAVKPPKPLTQRSGNFTKFSKNPFVENVAEALSTNIFKQTIDSIADSLGVNKNTALAIAQQESGLRQNIVGDKTLKNKAYGLYQVRKPALDDVNRLYKTNYTMDDVAQDPKINAEVGLRYYQAQKDFYGAKNDAQALRGYNGGPGAIKGKNKKANQYSQSVQATTKSFAKQYQDLNPPRYYDKIDNPQTITNITGPEARPTTQVPSPVPTPIVRQKVNYTQLAKASNIADPNKIFPGQTINLPGGSTYTVKSGDTLSKIAQNYNKGVIGENVPNTNKPGTIGQYINWAGKNAPDKPKSNVTIARRKQPEPLNWWQKTLQRGRDLFDSIESYTDPNFEVEWDEAKRYPEFVKIGKEAWIELAKTGKPINVDNELANKIENTEAGEENRNEFDKLEEPKKERFRKAVEAGTVELPIIARYSDGYLELVAGNTRLTGMMNEFGSGKAWIFDVPDEVAVLGESEQLELKKKFEITNELKQLDSIFKKGKHEIRIVGGAVRDLALGKSPKDIDLATDATPQEMQKMFDSAGVKHIPTGIEHGTITAVMNGEPYEITTLRADVETDGRRAEVEFVRSWEEDAKRRDLTYNAMSMDFDGNLYDYHGGMDDLQDKVTKFVGDPEERIKEDYLRTLRYFRFQGRLDTPTFDRATMSAIANNIDGLKQLSVERVWMEMGKILGGGNIKQILNAMDKTGVLSAIGLKYTPNNNLMDGGDPIINLARITDDESIGPRWKMSNEEKGKLGFLLAEKGKTHSKDWYTDMMVDGFDRTQLDALARYNNQDDMIQYIKTFKAPEFPVDGNDLIKIGHERGPGIGKTLMALRNQWKQGNFSASKDELLKNITEDEEFLYGDCPIFAIALSRISGLPLQAMIDYSHELDTTVLVHAFVGYKDGLVIDASGVRSIESIEDDYPVENDPYVTDISEKDLLALGYDGNCPTMDSANAHAKKVLADLKNITEDEEFNELDYVLKKQVKPSEAVMLTKLGKFHNGEDELEQFVPERKGKQYALHPDNWKGTYYSLTNLDTKKINYYRPKIVTPPAGSMVADMYIANQFYRTNDEDKKQQLAQAYKDSMVEYGADISHIKFPEILMPRINESKGYFTRTKSQASKGKALLRTVKSDLEKILKDIDHKLEPDSSGNRIIITVDKSDVERVRKLVGLPNLTKVVSEEGPFGVLARKAGHLINKSQYMKAAEYMHKILKRKYKETDGKIRHSLGYYAQMIASQTGMKLNWRELEQEYLNMYGKTMFEKINKNTPMGDVIDDFYKSDAPQFKGKSKEKRRQMAIAAKLSMMDSVDENFADGKKPGRKGLSKRVGIPKNATIAQLEKIAKNSTGERRRMAQWQLNMRRGKNKSK